MGVILHSLLIWPIKALIEVFFVFFMLVFNENGGLSIILLSLAVNTLLLPIYAIADRWQQEERDIRNRMRRKLADIKAVFRGDERQMIVNTYHRQMGYRPIYALRSSVGLLLQIPFFIAAYQFLSHTPSLRNMSFLFLRDLNAPDGLASLGNLTVNILPVIMTLVNIASTLVYTKGLLLRDRIQLFSMAGLFLILLYDSPSGLLLYWTVNNLYSLGKNLAKSLKNPGRVLYVFILAGCAGVLAALFFDVVALKPVYKIAITGMVLFASAAPFIWKALTALSRSIERHADGKEDFAVYAASLATMFALTGIVIPALLVGSSPTEFENAGSFLFRTALQAGSLFLLLPALLRLFASPRVRPLLSPAAAGGALLMIVFSFALPGAYGTMTRGFIFDNPHRLRGSYNFPLSVFFILATGAAVFLIYRFRKTVWLKHAMSIATLALVVTGGVNIYAIHNELSAGTPAETGLTAGKSQFDPVYRLSRTGKNIFVLMLDRAGGVAMPAALEELPGLRDALDGFTWYPNSLSFGDSTILGVPSLLGGYEYAPSAMNSRKDVPLVEKVNESLKLLPLLFGEAGYHVTITDPSLANLRWIPDTSIFDGIPNVTARNLKGLYKDRYLAENAFGEESETRRFDYDILLRFSLFRIAPPALRFVLYYNGDWWKDGRSSNAFERAVEVFPNLVYLTRLFDVRDEGNTLTIILNETTHESGAYTRDLVPSPAPVVFTREDVLKYGSERDAEYAYTFMAAMRQVKNWLEWLKDEGLYDNTKIYIVADHGATFHNTSFSKPGLERFNPLFLAKDYDARGELAVSGEFVTNADLPFFVTAELKNPVNPFTGKLIDASGKKNAQYAHDAPGNRNRHKENEYVLNKTWEIRNRNVFDHNNWVEVNP